MPKRSAQKVFSSGIVTVPPSLSPANSASASATSRAGTDSEKPPSGVAYYGGQSTPIRMLPSGNCRVACMILLPSPPGAWSAIGLSAQVLMNTHLAPSTAW